MQGQLLTLSNSYVEDHTSGPLYTGHVTKYISDVQVVDLQILWSYYLLLCILCHDTVNSSGFIQPLHDPYYSPCACEGWAHQTAGCFHPDRPDWGPPALQDPALCSPDWARGTA